MNPRRLRMRHLDTTSRGCTEVFCALGFSPNDADVQRARVLLEEEIASLTSERDIVLRRPLDRAQRIVAVSALAVHDGKLFAHTTDLDIWVQDNAACGRIILAMLGSLKEMIVRGDEWITPGMDPIPRSFE